MIRRRLFVLMLVAMNSLSLPAYGQKWGKVSQEEWDLQPPVMYPDANALIIFDKGIMEVSIEGISLERHVRVKIFNQAGVEETADRSFSYLEDDDIKLLKAQTVTPDGKKYSIGKREFPVQSSGSDRQCVFSFPNVEPGSVLEYTYRYVNKRFGFLEPWVFQNDLYTVESEFLLRLGAGFTYSSVTSNIPGGGRADYGGPPIADFTPYLWKMRDLKPVDLEPYMGALKDFLPTLNCQLVSYRSSYGTKYDFIRDWKDLGREFTDYVYGYTGSGENLQIRVDQITAGSSSNLAAAEALYNWVCDSIRTKRSDGWLIHENIGKLLEAGYGSGDEKNLLLMQMARRAGLRAWPVLISTRDHGTFNPQIYQIQQFDHVMTFLEIDSGGIFLDPTSKYCRFGLLPSDCLVDNGFLLNGEQSQVVKIITHEPRNYRLDRTFVEFDSAGSARCSTVCAFSGYCAVSYGQRYETEEPDVFIEDYFLGDLGLSYDLVGHEFSLDEDRNQCVLTLVYTLKEGGRWLDNSFLVRAPLLVFNKNPFKADKREHTIDFSYPFTYHSIVTLHPLNMTLDMVPPEEISRDVGGAAFRLGIHVEGENAVVESILKVMQPQFEPSKYADLKGLFEQVAAAHSEDVVFAPKRVLE